MKHVLLWMLSMLLMLLAAVPAHADGYTQIATPEEFLAIADNPGGSYLLTEDLDMTGVEWKCFDFSGTLDGGGHSILNLAVTQPGENKGIAYDGNQKTYEARFAGLFASIDGARIENLNLVNMRAKVVCDEPCFLGGIAGNSRSSEIVNCGVQGVLELRAHDRMFGVGGVTGYGSGSVDGSRVDVTLICADTDAQTRDEQFLGGVLATGFMSVRDCEVSIDGYVSEHGYTHNGGICGMLLQYPLGSGRKGEVSRNHIAGKIAFFEDNPDRRAYCEAVVGEALVFNCSILDNTDEFQRDERMAYDVELRPEMCEKPVYTQEEVMADCESFGYTQFTCASCGYTYRDLFTPHAHTVTKWTVAVPATVEAEGDSVGFCDNCGKELHQKLPVLEPTQPTQPETEESLSPIPPEETASAEGPSPRPGHSDDLPAAMLLITLGILAAGVLWILTRQGKR